MFLLFTLILFFLWRFVRNHFLIPKKNDVLTIYFGVPGAGKTTLASALCKHYMKHYNVLSNVPIKGAFQYDVSDIGVYDISNCLLLLDEAAIDYNNRNWKHGSMTPAAIRFWKLHRHYGVKAVLFSQSWNDCDVTLRRLAYDYALVRRSHLPFFITTVRIKRKITINEQTHEPCDDYSFDHPIIRLFTNKRYFAPKYWKYFNSWDAPTLPEKIMKKY